MKAGSRRQWDPGKPLRDLTPGRWIEERLWPWGTASGRDGVAVGSIVPEGFEAYARLLHPAMRQSEQGVKAVSWATVASSTGRTVHPLMQFERIADLPVHQRGMWAVSPSEGELPIKEADRLTSVLRAFTSTPDRCYFALWEGYGVPALHALQDFPRLKVPNRAYFVFPGPIEAASLLTIGDFRHTPNLWWPDDRAWCVGTDIDLFDTYIGASQPCIDSLLADPELETFPVDLADRVDIGADDINK